MEHPPIGFRFYPTEEELVAFYLHNQLEGQRNEDITRVIPVIDISGIEPWNLPSLAGELCRGDTEQWFFFAPRQEREARGGRPNRTTASGYWKATGSPGYVYSSDNKVIGMKKTMVFYKGKAPSGTKTKWKMHEYRAIELSDPSSRATPKLRNEFSLCRVYVISGSFQAFDRRPLESSRVELRIDGDRGGGSSAQQQVAQAVVDGSSSSETSHSGGGDHSAVYLPTEAAGSSGTNWNANDDGVEEPLWEWEQLNWF